ESTERSSLVLRAVEKAVTNNAQSKEGLLPTEQWAELPRQPGDFVPTKDVPAESSSDVQPGETFHAWMLRVAEGRRGSGGRQVSVNLGQYGATRDGLELLPTWAVCSPDYHEALGRPDAHCVEREAAANRVWKDLVGHEGFSLQRWAPDERGSEADRHAQEKKPQFNVKDLPKVAGEIVGGFVRKLLNKQQLAPEEEKCLQEGSIDLAKDILLVASHTFMLTQELRGKHQDLSNLGDFARMTTSAPSQEFLKQNGLFAKRRLEEDSLMEDGVKALSDWRLQDIVVLPKGQIVICFAKEWRLPKGLKQLRLKYCNQPLDPHFLPKGLGTLDMVDDLKKALCLELAERWDDADKKGFGEELGMVFRTLLFDAYFMMLSRRALLDRTNLVMAWAPVCSAAALPSWVQSVLAPVLAAVPQLSELELRSRGTVPDEMNEVWLAAAAAAQERSNRMQLLELRVQKAPPLVEVYKILEHGRHYYRSLTFTSDTGWSFHVPGSGQLLLQNGHGAAGWSIAAGEVPVATQARPSVVVLREHPSKFRQTHLPRRALHGLLPDALLGRYRFWRCRAAAKKSGAEGAFVGEELRVREQASRLHIFLFRSGEGVAARVERAAASGDLEENTGSRDHLRIQVHAAMRCLRFFLVDLLLLAVAIGALVEAPPSDCAELDVDSVSEEIDSPVVLLQQNLQLTRRPQHPRNASSDRRPNLLLILLDQWRADWAGFDDALVSMPTVKSLASVGTRFTRAYTTSPLCVPARSSLTAVREYKDMWVQKNQDIYASPQMSPTFMSRLRDAGYTTIFAGKDHLSGDSGNLINATEMEVLGVDLFARSSDKYGICKNASKGGVMDHFGLHLKENDLFHAYCDAVGTMGRGGCCNSTPVCETIFMDECGFRCKQEGCLEPDVGVDHWSRLQAEVLLQRHWKRHGDKPWFLQLGFPSPHPPFATSLHDEVGPLPDAVDAQFDYIWAQNTEGRMIQFPNPFRSSVDVRQSRESYARLLGMLDREIHQLLHFLEKHDARENTVIAVTSDHGEHLGDHGEWAKSSPWEPSVKIPLILAGPSIRKDAIEEAPVSLIDVPRTLLDFAGATPAQAMGGYSLLPTLRGSGPVERPAVLSGLYMPTWEDSGWLTLSEYFETVAALFNGGQFLKLVCCPRGCSKQGTLLPFSSLPQLALMNVTSGAGPTKFEHDILNKPSGNGVAEAKYLAEYLSSGSNWTCFVVPAGPWFPEVG
ncbi:Choline-sulfatase, partial [Symbiodinium microadriaticum]